jgi:hypothetical protein
MKPSCVILYFLEDLQTHNRLTKVSLNSSNFFLFLCTRIFQEITWLGLREKKKVLVR